VSCVDERNPSSPTTDADTYLSIAFSPSSFENVTHKWFPEIQHHAPGVPFILVGTKLDLREDEETLDRLREKRLAPVTEAEGMKQATDLGAYKYLECSALTQKGLKHVFDDGIRCVMSNQASPQKKKGIKCVVL
jgi:GTPase SAR1 family protein